VELAITLNRSAPPLLSHQISRAIIDMIGRGVLPAGARLPATRELARRLCVGRTTVVEAYDMLAEQGYIRARRGSGTLVQEAPCVAAPLLDRHVPREQRVSRKSASQCEPKIDFRPDLPDLASFPKRQWLASLVRCVRDITKPDLDLCDPLGSNRLRRAVACYLGRSRRLEVDPRNIVITSGNVESADLILRVVAGSVTEAVVEEPGALWLQEVLTAHALTIRKLPLDCDGLRTDLLPGHDTRRLACVAPGHQWPIGCVMTPERRSALLSWATRTDSYIFEDDSDRELAMQASPVPPLALLDLGGTVIYSGSFSKTLVPALRVGFVVLPAPLLERVRTERWWIDRGGPVLHQDALADWLEKGTYERHVQHMRRIYRERFNVLTAALESSLGDRIRILGQPIGTHMTVLVQTDLPAEELSRRAHALGVKVHPLEGHLAIANTAERGFVFGFGNLSRTQILSGVHTFADVVLSS
jgi:GntR family transcriptional regulator / MocR family aminotransferase